MELRLRSCRSLAGALPNGAELDDAAAARSVECRGSDMRVVCVAGFRHGRPSVRLYGVLQYSTAMMRLGVCVPKSRVETKALFLVSLGSIIIDVLQLSTIIIMQLSILIMHANSDNCFNLFLFEPTRCTFIYRL